MSENTILEARHITRTYHTSSVPAEALKDCSITFETGKFTVIVGPSGSGKSTLLRLLGTLDAPDSGDILLRGKSILNLPDAEVSRLRRQEIGFVPQDYSLFPEYTAWENVILPLRLDGQKENDEEVEDIFSLLGISHCRDKFPAEPSGGEQQRVAIARALAIHPAIILADEPTGNLDAENSLAVIQLLSRACEVYHQTIAMVTHDRQSADYADRVLTIKDGWLTEDV